MQTCSSFAANQNAKEPYHLSWATLVAAYEHLSINLQKPAWKHWSLATRSGAPKAHQRQEVLKYTDLDAHDSREDLGSFVRASGMMCKTLSCRAMEFLKSVVKSLSYLCFPYLSVYQPVFHLQIVISGFFLAACSPGIITFLVASGG